MTLVERVAFAVAVLCSVAVGWALFQVAPWWVWTPYAVGCVAFCAAFIAVGEPG